MNPGAVEEAGKVAGGFVDAMKSQPLALALVLMNVLLIAIFWFVINKTSDNARERETALLNEQKEVRELLSHCVVPSKGETQ